MADDLRLTVVASSIDGKGIVKLDCDSFRSLKLCDGAPVIITYGAKSQEFSAKLDSIFSERTARLMKSDMMALRVEEGMQITIAKKNSNAAQEGPAKKSKSRKKPKANAASLDTF